MTTTHAPRSSIVSRRTFMVGTAGLTFGIALGLDDIAAPAAASNGVIMNPWVTIAADGTVAIMSPATEMGQGSMTSLPLILAEELDADWAKVRVVPAPPIDAIYGNPGFMNVMYTAASVSVTGYFKSVRQFGAQVRRVLLANAARHWGGDATAEKPGPDTVVVRELETVP